VAQLPAPDSQLKLGELCQMLQNQEKLFLADSEK
jgi:hypothetical protein